MAHRILKGTTESVWNTFDTSPAASFFLPCDSPSIFRPMKKRPFWGIQDGSGLNIPRLRGSEVYQVSGSLQTRTYWESVRWLMGMAQRVNTGSTLPWPTNQRPLDYASMTFDFAYGFEDDTLKKERYLGLKLGQSARIECQNNPDNPFLNINFDLIGGLPSVNVYTGATAPTLTDPALSAFPSSPLTFQETTFTTYGSPLPFFDKFSIAINSKVKPYYDNGRFPNRIHCRGRTVTLTVHPLFQPGTDARIKYEAVQALGALSILFTNPVIAGGHTTADTLLFDFKSTTFLDSVAEEMLLDEDPYVEWTATAHLDLTAGDDFDIVFTPGA